MKDETLIKAANLWFWKKKLKKINIIYHPHRFAYDNGKRVLIVKFDGIHHKFWFDENTLRSEAYV